MADEPKTGESAGLAAAMASGRDSARADDFFEEQARLTRLQIAQIEEENSTRRRLLRIEHASALFKLALEIAVAVVAAVIVIGLASMMWNASRDNGLVVQSFSVPPDLANRGLTGEVIAAKLLDKLSSLQSATISNRASSSYANNWGDDIKLQIPDTGVSIGEFNRTLHAWLGRQTRITGEVWRTATGLAVTARAGNDTSPTFTGSDAELVTLIRKAAESVYHSTQPYRYAVYLANVNRTKEAEAAYEDLIANGSPTDRAWALIGLENTYANRAEYKRSIGLLNRALAIKPDFIMSYVNRAGIEGQFQHDELAYLAMRKVVEIAQGSRDPDMSEIAWKMGMLSGQATLAADLGDYKTQMEYNHQLEAMREFSGQVENAHQNDITGYASMHDGAGAREAFDNLTPNGNKLVALQRQGTYAFAQMLLDHPETMMSMRETFDKLLASLGPAGRQAQKSQFWPFVAYGFALRGDFKSAHDWVDKTSVDCTQCLSIRARIDALEKNWGGANYWCARAVRFAPSMPQPMTEWGRVLLMKGDFDGAIAKLEAAHAKGPNFADPLEMWGEALLAKHQADEAAAKFAAANMYAPNWGRLHLKWGEALSFLGREDDAREQFAIARGLSMTTQEKGELASATHG